MYVGISINKLRVENLLLADESILFPVLVVAV
jgi:hypothetical protein